MGRRAVVFVVLLAVMSLGDSVPAFAKGNIDFVISGGGLPEPVSIALADINMEVRGEIWSPADPPDALVGRPYKLDFYMTDGSGRRRVGRWLYYPSAGGALIVEPEPTAEFGEPLLWERFSPAFQHVLNAAINSRSTSIQDLSVGLVIVAGVLAAGLLLFGKRTRFEFSYG